MATSSDLMEGVPWRREEAASPSLVDSPLTLAVVLVFAIVSFHLLPLLLPPLAQDGGIFGPLLSLPRLLERPDTSSPRVTKQNTDISTQVWWLPHRYLCGHHHTCVLMTTHMWLFPHKCGDDHICTYVVITTPVTSWPRVTKQKTNISKQVCT